MSLQEFTTAGTSTISVPPGATVMVQAWGAGGGGGGGGGNDGNNDPGSGGGSGGSGGYTRAVLTVSPANGTLTVTVGGGGTGGAGGGVNAGGATGGAGAATSVSNGGPVLVTATGGGGGAGGHYGSQGGDHSGGVGGGAGALGTFPAGGGYSRTGYNGNQGATYNPAQLGLARGAGPGAYVSEGSLPAAANTGGTGGNGWWSGTAATSGATGASGYALVTVLAGPAPVPAGVPVYTGQQIIPYTGVVSGQTINSANSYVTAAAVSGSGSVTVTVNLAQTNHPGSAFQLYSIIDSGGPTGVAGQFTTDGNGSGAFAFTLSGLATGSHTLAIDINNVPSGGGGGDTYYVNSGSTRIPFTC